MAKKLNKLAARVAALEHAIAEFFSARKPRAAKTAKKSRKAKKAGAKKISAKAAKPSAAKKSPKAESKAKAPAKTKTKTKAKSKKAATPGRKKTVLPPPASALVPSGAPEFATPVD